MTSEYQLIVLIYVLYFMKNIMQINSKEFVIVDSCKEWKVVFPSDKIKIINKSIILLNPFKFFYATFLLHENNEVKQSFFLKKLKIISQRLFILIPIVSFIWINIFIVIPVSFYLLHTKLIIVLVSILYLSIIFLLIQVWFLRKKLFLTMKDFRSIAIDCILCPPFAANTIRDISLLYKGKIE